MTQARKIFESQILAQFIAQINTLKTASVRNSRLTNQTRDLRNVFENEVVPLITKAKARTSVAANLLPEFHTGLQLAPYETFAKVLKNESIVTVAQRNRANQLAGFDVLTAAGVPGTIGQTQNGVPVAHNGGTYRGEAVVPTFTFENITVVMGEGEATRILGAAVRTPDGKRQIIGVVKDGKQNGTL